ncbi:hypothetical protein CRG98_015800 [Punica granatum]|nr:hypothetical protein CRG98_015800 [Punica granatum]
MLEGEGLSKVLPGVNTFEDGVQIYRRFYMEEKERDNGVLAIDILKSSHQPYISVARIISVLGYNGVHNLLGLVHTAGTVSDSLPPPRSALLSALQQPYNRDVKGSTLTDGARALAKHFSRSSSKYWGSLDGSDSRKNKAAMDIITCLISSCCWLNLHVVPPHGVVFEIRDANGYGARWSGDGSKFIGFLEPYMKDGHLRRWRH